MLWDSFRDYAAVRAKLQALKGCSRKGRIRDFFVPGRKSAGPFLFPKACQGDRTNNITTWNTKQTQLIAKHCDEQMLRPTRINLSKGHSSDGPDQGLFGPWPKKCRTLLGTMPPSGPSFRFGRDAVEWCESGTLLARAEKVLAMPGGSHK